MDGTVRADRPARAIYYTDRERADGFEAMPDHRYDLLIDVLRRPAATLVAGKSLGGDESQVSVGGLAIGA
jgi:hypothetical protein